jgi:hypothetical protein
VTAAGWHRGEREPQGLVFAVNVIRHPDHGEGGRAVSKAQEIYEKVNALTDQGVKKADAFRQVAEEYGQPFNSMRGAFYAHARTLNPDASSGTGRSRGGRATRVPADPIASATAVLEQAIEAIDREIDAAREKAEQAKEHYEQLVASAAERKLSLQQKIDSLNN